MNLWTHRRQLQLLSPVCPRSGTPGTFLPASCALHFWWDLLQILFTLLEKRLSFFLFSASCAEQQLARFDFPEGFQRPCIPAKLAAVTGSVGSVLTGYQTAVPQILVMHQSHNDSQRQGGNPESATRPDCTARSSSRGREPLWRTPACEMEH